MSAMRELKAVVRKECVHEIVHALRKAGVSRFHVCHVHVIGAGVDPEHFQLSMEEGEAYQEKAKIELLCPADRVDELLELLRASACTGHRGDGVVIVSAVEGVVNVRTGDHDTLALV